MNPQLLQDELNRLKRRVDTLEKSFYQGNFLTSQDFGKYCRFNSRLKIPSYSSEPATCEVGELIEVSGVLKICSSADTWTVAGNQT